MSDKIIFEVFSDGSSFNNGKKNPKLPQFASCGIVVTYNKRIVYKACKGFKDETISHAELHGAILAIQKTLDLIEPLKSIRPPYNIHLYSDSQFVIKGVNEWMKGWIKRGWKNNQGNPVGQKDLWVQLREEYLLRNDINFQFHHIKGHTNGDDFYSQMNELCDTIAGEKIELMTEEIIYNNPEYTP